MQHKFSRSEINFANYFLYFKFVLLNGSVLKESGKPTFANVPSHAHIDGDQQGHLVQAPKYTLN